MKRETILFDINETTLDLSPLQSEFISIFGHKSFLQLWFSKLLHLSTISAITKLNTTFAELAKTALEDITHKNNIEIKSNATDSILSKFATLEPYDDMLPGLELLKNNNIRTVAFSNSSNQLIASQIKYSNLLGYFDEVISVEEFGSFKPDEKVYFSAAKRLKKDVNSLMMVAAHDWDVHGAMSVGMGGAFLNRNSLYYNPNFIKPDIESDNMISLSKEILERNE
jgi:2-haloacid dehalogenase